MKFFGNTYFSGQLSGTIRVYRRRLGRVTRVHTDDARGEIKRFYEAKRKAEEQYEYMSRVSDAEYGAGAGDIFTVHRMMMNDAEFCGSVCSIIESDKTNCETAVFDTCYAMREIFSDIDNEYIRARYEDMCDVSENLLCVLSGNYTDALSSDESIVLVSDRISCHDLFLFRHAIAASVVEIGSLESHAAQFSGILGIPFICGANGIMRPDFDFAKVCIRAGEISVLK